MQLETAPNSIANALYRKYEWIRNVRYAIARYGSSPPETFYLDMDSGMAAGTVFADAYLTFEQFEIDSAVASGSVSADAYSTIKHPDDYDPASHEYPNPAAWIEGGDAALFDVLDDLSIIANVRPLPAGEYRFYFNNRADIHTICDAYPDELRDDIEFVARVTAPDDVVHEALFDSTDIGEVVGADGDSGMLEPDGFGTDSGFEVVMERIGRQAGHVEMELSQPIDLADHRLDFIALDGSVALRLDFDDATEAGEENKTKFTWNVCDAPWQDGDQLMLRLGEGIPDDGVPATDDFEC